MTIRKLFSVVSLTNATRLQYSWPMIKNNIQNILPQNGRLTVARESIWNCFAQQKEPLDYSQILSYLNSRGINVNKTTIYRQLDYFQENGLIQELDLGEGKKRYEILSRHHHHLLCTKCNKVECIEFEEDFSSQIVEISKSTNFKVTGHMLEFLGICEKCQC